MTQLTSLRQDREIDDNKYGRASSIENHMFETCCAVNNNDFTVDRYRRVLHDIARDFIVLFRKVLERHRKEEEEGKTVLSYRTIRLLKPIEFDLKDEILSQQYRTHLCVLTERHNRTSTNISITSVR
jgi:hypothetical protein